MSKVKNKSRTYLLPLLSSRVPIKHAYTGNTYLNTYDDFELYRLHVIHSFDDVNVIDEYDDELSKFNNFKGKTKIDGTPNSFIYHFVLDNDLKEAYKCFVQGKYSKIPNIDKNTINNYWYDVYSKTNRNFLLTLKQILNKDEKLRQKLEEELNTKLPEGAELSSIINIEDEIYYYGD